MDDKAVGKDRDHWMDPTKKLSLLPDWPPLLTTLQDQLNSYKEAQVSKHANDINTTLASLSRSLDFYCNLKDTQDGEFKGRIHCEACLASLIAGDARQVIQRNGNYESALGATAVSKMAMPVDVDI